MLKLACLVVLLLVINTTDVVDIVLNFTAVNFISAFDDVGKQKCLKRSGMVLKLSIRLNSIQFNSISINVLYTQTKKSEYFYLFIVLLLSNSFILFLLIIPMTDRSI